MAKLQGDERDLYLLMQQIARAHTSTVDGMALKGFYVGYWEDLNTNNLKAEPNSEYFYSEAWEDAGSAPDQMRPDYPMVYLFPPQSTLQNPRNQGFQSFACELLVLDLYKHTPEREVSTARALRTKEDIWRDTNQMGREFIKQLANYTELTEGPVFSRLAEVNTSRHYGTGIRFTVRLQPCDATPGTFDFNVLDNPLSVFL